MVVGDVGMAQVGAGARAGGVEAAGSPQEAWHRWVLREPREAMVGRDTAWRWLEAAHSAGAHVCTLDNPTYPPLLRELTDAPPVLFWRGTWPSEKAWSRSLAVVGTRNCTTDMACAAREAACDWSSSGGTVVSGLAHGIDGQAHRGALEGARPHAQVAVLPCALDQVFPRIHVSLAHRIEEAGGFLVSEQPPGRQVERWMFAARNRIVTGLSAATVVVQSPARSGSLISAKCAHDQDRELYTFHQPQWGVLGGEPGPCGGRHGHAGAGRWGPVASHGRPLALGGQAPQPWAPGACRMRGDVGCGRCR